ncbi:hypothetical protein AGR4C_pa50032 [Agrobacterium tumefaciens str. Kerr 14]|uniref:Uncharacterized protein n=1 Tax=Agrobacterium tumefaciens str. Kerr 14 TaxID=1183424 RepID=A0A1S7SB65_AGRTU|nr:hypothetical protein AGR4C_pa50032 [Agrobacterium tumefaciens str. Kerr 14]
MPLIRLDIASVRFFEPHYRCASAIKPTPRGPLSGPSPAMLPGKDQLAPLQRVLLCRMYDHVLFVGFRYLCFFLKADAALSGGEAYAANWDCFPAYDLPLPSRHLRQSCQHADRFCWQDAISRVAALSRKQSSLTPRTLRTGCKIMCRGHGASNFR